MSEQKHQDVERLVMLEQWDDARRVIRERLPRNLERCSFEDHWLLTRLSLSYYEQRRYKRALSCSQRAHSVAPRCPLVLWDLAGALDAAGQTHDAILVWRRLIRRGPREVAFAQCGEGLAWATSLVNDCRYRLALVHLHEHRVALARRYLHCHVKQREKGTQSIYSLNEVKRRLGCVLP